MSGQQLRMDFDNPLLNWKTGQVKKQVLRIVTAATKRLNSEKGISEEEKDRRWKLKIIKREFSKLADEL